MHVIVAGDIAAGKSTATHNLSAELGLPEFPERPQSNPYISNFYNDPQRWALSSQLFFLVDEFDQQQTIRTARSGGVQDHSFYEVHEVFDAVLAEDGILSKNDYSLLDSVYTQFLSIASEPDAVAYLHAPAGELHKRIMERGRPYEADVSMRYIHRLSERRRRLFRDWDRCPVIEVDTSLTDLREPGQISQLAMQITVAVKSSA